MQKSGGQFSFGDTRSGIAQRKTERVKKEQRSCFLTNLREVAMSLMLAVIDKVKKLKTFSSVFCVTEARRTLHRDTSLIKY